MPLEPSLPSYCTCPSDFQSQLIPVTAIVSISSYRCNNQLGNTSGNSQLNLLISFQIPEPEPQIYTQTHLHNMIFTVFKMTIVNIFKVSLNCPCVPFPH